MVTSGEEIGQGLGGGAWAVGWRPIDPTTLPIRPIRASPTRLHHIYDPSETAVTRRNHRTPVHTTVRTYQSFQFPCRTFPWSLCIES